MTNCQHVYQEESLFIIHWMEGNLEIHLDEIHLEEIHLEDHHLVHMLDQTNPTNT